jgi:hypothetical protein
MKKRFNGRAVICLTLMVISLAALFLARKWPMQTGLFPIVSATVIFLLSIPTLILILTGKGEGSGKQAAVDRDFAAAVDGDEAAARRKVLIAFGWVIGLFLLILFLGFPVGITLFVLVYTKFQGKEKWWISVTMAFCSWLFIWGLFIRLLHIPFQQGLVERGLNLLGIG